jgi:hypothetical protein
MQLKLRIDPFLGWAINDSPKPEFSANFELIHCQIMKKIDFLNYFTTLFLVFSRIGLIIHQNTEVRLQG